jgi:molybdate/tungstate transport system substrate-binding protein
MVGNNRSLRQSPAAALRAASLAILLAGACGGDRAGANAASRTVAVAAAGSLARPLAAALDTLARREGLAARTEHAGSLELARRTADLRQPPDLLLVADAEVIAERLMPDHATWYVVFASDRLTLGHRAGSPFARRLRAEPWHRAATDAGVALGRSDPDLDPAGYRALLAGELAERHHREPGLAARLLARAPAANVRPKSADLVALVQAGELDAAWLYESVARSPGLATVRLPDAVSLGAPAESLAYAAASVRVAGRRRGDTVVVRGRPIRFALTIPRGAANPDGGARVAAWLLSAEGRALLGRFGLDASEAPRLVSSGAPARIRAAVGAP